MRFIYELEGKSFLIDFADVKRSIVIGSFTSDIQIPQLFATVKFMGASFILFCMH